VSLIMVTKLQSLWASKIGRSVCGAAVSSSPANTARFAGRAKIDPSRRTSSVCEHVTCVVLVGAGDRARYLALESRRERVASSHYGD
jgi:hypothetical protein